MAGGGPFHPDFPDLFLEHVNMLRDESGIADEEIRARGYESILGKKKLHDLGFSAPQQRSPGLLIPIHTTDGQAALHLYRPDHPRSQDGKPIKYETPPRTGLRVDVPPRVRPSLGNPSIPLYITEGVKKANAGVSHGLSVVDVLGVWNFRGRNEFGGITWLGDWQDIALNDRNDFNARVHSSATSSYRLDQTAKRSDSTTSS